MAPERPQPAGTRRFRLRGVLWVSALLLGGLGLIVLAYSLVAGVSLVYTLAAVAFGLFGVAYMIAVLLAFERSPQAGNSRWYDRERRGF